MSDRYITSIKAKEAGWPETAYLIHRDNTIIIVEYNGAYLSYDSLKGKTFDEVLAAYPEWTETTFEMCKHLMEVGHRLQGDAAVEAIAKYHKPKSSNNPKKQEKQETKSEGNPRDWQTEIFRRIFS